MADIYNRLMSQTAGIRLDEVFAALAHPVRRAILEQCGQSPCSVAGLARPHSMSLNAISKHIKTLEGAQLVTRSVDGNTHWISIEPSSLEPALEWLEYHSRLWECSLMNLKSQLEKSR